MQNVQQQGKQFQTGASDLEYDLVAEMHEILEGTAALERYIEDARRVGDDEVERCFQHIHDQNRENVHALRGLLAKRLGTDGQEQAQRS